MAFDAAGRTGIKSCTNVQAMDGLDVQRLRRCDICAAIKFWVVLNAAAYYDYANADQVAGEIMSDASYSLAPDVKDLFSIGLNMVPK